LIIFEDAHWTDPTGLELFSRIIDKIPTLRVLLLITFRPEFEPPWVGQPHVTTLTINRLTRREVEVMIDRVVGNKVLPTNIRQDIIERTDGIPLFVEEMTKAVLEVKDEEASERTVGVVSLPSIAVPPSLHASLMARLDRLGPAKEVAQIGAAIGREFTHALLAAIIRKPEEELGPALDRIVRADLLFRQGIPPHATYLFKHVLIQDAAYGTLLREPRRTLHARVAETLESGFADIAENQPEILARHCTEAGLIEKAADFWGKAGLQSSERSALIEAAAQFTRALDLITTLPGTPALCRKQIKCQIGLTFALMHTRGYAASETRASLEQARALIKRAEAMGEPPEDPVLLFSVLHGFWVASFNAFNGDVTCNLAAELLSLAEKQRLLPWQMIGHQITGHSLSATGELSDGRTHFDVALTLYGSIKHRPWELRFGIETLVAILSIRSHVLWQLGYPDAALADVKRALQEARDSGQAVSLMFALFWTSLTQILCGNFAAATKQHDELIALADEKGSLFWRAYCTSTQGCLFALTGKASDAVKTINAGIAACRSTGASFFAPFSLSYLAKANAEIGQFDDAWRCIGDALTAIETTKEKWHEAEVNRIAGEIALKSPEPDPTKAETYFERALSVARQQQAKSWELRPAMSLARLWRSRGKVQQARELLAPVYGWFTEGFDTRDLKDAKALLEELAA
jgi:predicted ATPase